MFPDTRDEVVQLYLDDIIPNRFQPREVFDERALKELAISIKEHGVIQPIIVRKVNEKYEIIAGERRYKASALAGLTKIPAIVRDLDDKESSKVALLENLQRKNLNPIEEARTYQKILELDEMTQEELAKTMGKSQSAVANKIRLLSLPDEVQDALLKEQISERHARTLLNIPDPSKQKEVLKKVIDTKMSVRALEEEIKEMYPKDSTKEPENIPEISATKSYIIDNPLMPTAELPADQSNFGKVTIAPPDGEEAPTNKFINYGEIGKEDDNDINYDLPESIPQVNIDEIKEKSSDISINDNGAALDSLLNIKTEPTKAPENSFIPPTTKEVETNIITEDNYEKSSDYFNNSDLSAVEIPSIEDNEIYSMEYAKELLQKTISELKKHGIEVNTDEMDFEKSYQLIIKINKNNE